MQRLGAAGNAGVRRDLAGIWMVGTRYWDEGLQGAGRISEKDNTIESLQKLVYDFLEAGQAISASSGIDNISDWVHSVVDKLTPSIQEYSRKQIDLVIALILLERSVRDTSYRDVLNRFTEIYKNEGGVS